MTSVLLRKRIFLVFFLLLFIISGCETKEEKKGGIRSKLPDEGDLAPAFTLKTFEGLELRLDEFKGKPLVLNFWASWCIPCKAEAEDLQATYTIFKELGVEFIGVAVQDTEDEARGFIAEYGITYPNGLDDSGDIAHDYKIYGIPKTLVVNKEGKFTFMHTGAVSKEMLSEELEKVL